MTKLHYYIYSKKWVNKKAIQWNVLRFLPDINTPVHLDQQNLVLIFLFNICFQVKFVAEKIDLPEPEVEKKLSQMILDKKFQGILDQETRVLIIFEASERDETYDNVIETVGAMSKVVDRLYQAAQKLTWEI